MEKTEELHPYISITFDTECDDLSWSGVVVSNYHFIDVTEQTVSLPQGMAEPRLSQIELVNICLACQRNVLQSSWVCWSTDEPIVFLLGLGITVNLWKTKSLFTVNPSQVASSDAQSPLFHLCCFLSAWDMRSASRMEWTRVQSSKSNMLSLLSYPQWRTVDPGTCVIQTRNLTCQIKVVDIINITTGKKNNNNILASWSPVSSAEPWVDLSSNKLVHKQVPIEHSQRGLEFCPQRDDTG